MKAVLTIPVDELAEILGALGEYNGHKVESISFFDAEGQRVQVARADLTTQARPFAVRVAEDSRLESLSELLQRVRGSYGTTGGGGGGSQSGGGIEGGG